MLSSSIVPDALPGSLQALLDAWLPQVTLQALFIVLASILVAWVVRSLLRVVVGGWTRRTRTDLDDRFLAMLARPVFVSVVLVGLHLATVRLGLADPLPRLTLAALKTVGILVWTVFGFRFSTLSLEILGHLERKTTLIQPTTVPLFDNLAKVVLVGGALYLGFLSWNIDLSGWLASAGIVGIAVGFAAKDTLANLFAGVFILADAPYKVGDYVNLDQGERGKVTHIGIRSTRLLTRDDVEITVPNAVIANAKIVNETGGRWDRMRIRIKVGVAYGSDVDQVRAVLLEIAIAEPQLCEEPEPRVRFRSFGDSSLDFELLAWIEEPELRGRVIDALMTAIYKRFGTEGIEFPYPKRDVYVREWPARPEGLPEG